MTNAGLKSEQYIYNLVGWAVFLLSLLTLNIHSQLSCKRFAAILSISKCFQLDSYLNWRTLSLFMISVPFHCNQCNYKNIHKYIYTACGRHESRQIRIWRYRIHQRMEALSKNWLDIVWTWIRYQFEKGQRTHFIWIMCKLSDSRDRLFRIVSKQHGRPNNPGRIQFTRHIDILFLFHNFYCLIKKTASFGSFVYAEMTYESKCRRCT